MAISPTTSTSALYFDPSQMTRSKKIDKAVAFCSEKFQLILNLFKLSIDWTKTFFSFDDRHDEVLKSIRKALGTSTYALDVFKFPLQLFNFLTSLSSLRQKVITWAKGAKATEPTTEKTASFSEEFFSQMRDVADFTGDTISLFSESLAPALPVVKGVKSVSGIISTSQSAYSKYSEISDITEKIQKQQTDNLEKDISKKRLLMVGLAKNLSSIGIATIALIGIFANMAYLTVISLAFLTVVRFGQVYDFFFSENKINIESYIDPYSYSRELPFKA